MPLSLIADVPLADPVGAWPLIGLDLVGVFVFGLSGGLAAVRKRFDIVGVLVVAFAAGIAMWLWLPGPGQWSAFIVLSLAIAVAGVAWGRGRLGRALLLAGLALAAGSANIWARSAWVAAPRLEPALDLAATSP